MVAAVVDVPFDASTVGPEGHAAPALVFVAAQPFGVAEASINPVEQLTREVVRKHVGHGELVAIVGPKTARRYSGAHSEEPARLCGRWCSLCWTSCLSCYAIYVGVYGVLFVRSDSMNSRLRWADAAIAGARG